MNSHLVSRIARRKLFVALVLTAYSLFGAALRCVAAPTLSLSPASWTQVTVTQGASSTAIFNIAGGGSFQGNVTLAIAGLPAGVTASWSQNPLPLNSGTGVVTLTLQAGAAVPVGSATFTVTASGDGVSVYHNYTLQVQHAPGVQLTASHQSLSMWSMYSTTVIVTLAPVGGALLPSVPSPPVVSGLPAGITASWSTPGPSGTGAAIWTLTLTGSATAVASSGTFAISALALDARTKQIYSASLAIPLTVSFDAPTLKLSAALAHVPVIQGGQASDLLTLTGGGSFHGNVSLAVTGMPSFVNYSLSSNPVALASGSGSATLTLAPSATATVNWFTFTVTASGDGLTVSNNYTVEIEPSAGIQVQLSNSAATIEPNGTATLSVTAKPINGIALPPGAAGASAAVVSGLPAGVVASWSGPTVTSAGAAAWTLTLAAPAGAQTGSSPVSLGVQITDANSGLVYSAGPSFTLLTSLLATVSMGSTPISNIPATFMGLSHEWGDAQWQMGSTATGVNPIYRQLLSNLTAYGSGPINLRIGGNSTDHTGEPTSTTMAPFAQLANSIGAQFELGVNLGSGNVSLAVAQAQNYVGSMPAGSIKALEVGNEVDLYPVNGLRPSTYDFQDYLQEFNTWQQNITPVLPQGVALAGPVGSVFGGQTPAEVANVQTYLADESSFLGMFTQHYYTASPANNPAPDFLLTPAAAASGSAWVAPAVQAAHSSGIPFRMGEMGAISNGGESGVSNTFASALWAVDTMFNYASVGVDGVNWQASNGNYNEPFFFTSSTSKGIATYALGTLNPVYYGLLFFQKALGGGAQLFPVQLSTPANLTAWAVATASASPRIAIINKDEVQSGTVSIAMPGYSQATVVSLLAPSYTSTNGITFAGQTMDGSLDGTLQGSQTERTIEADSNGNFQVAMPVTSAALVIFTPAAPAISRVPRKTK